MKEDLCDNEIAAKDCEKNVIYYITGAWYGYMNTPVKLHSRFKNNKNNKTYQEFVFKSLDKKLDFVFTPDEILFINEFKKL